MNNNYLLPDDTGWPEDKALMAELSRLNSEITRYVLGYLVADAGKGEPISTVDEQAFGDRIIDLGKRVQDRATRRAAPTTGHGPTVEGDAAPPALEPGRPPDTEHGL